MLCRVLTFGFAFVLVGEFAIGQTCYPDQKPDPAHKHHEFRMEVPLGQTFVSNKWGNTCKLVKTHVPQGNPTPVVRTDSFPDRLVTTMIMTPAPAGHQAQLTTPDMVGNNSNVHQYQMNAVTAMGNPEDFLLELSPDPGRPSALNLNLGFGSARLDLSDLSIDGIHIQSAGADVIISYNMPNRTSMKNMWITGGMSMIVLRNLEMSHAEVVTVENGMGESQIIVGAKPDKTVTVQLGVGAGSATILINDNVPLKVVISENVFSNFSLPDGMIEMEKNVFVNLPYKANPRNAFVFDVDLGIGELNVITFRQ